MKAELMVVCGIVGYVGQDNGTERLLGALADLEYRGYDSAGIAVFENGGVRVVKTRGRLADLREKLAAEGMPAATCGIGHTRWATHGEPSDRNAHPHQSGRVTLVHNGIIENYKALRSELIAAGYTFRSETDTETVAHLLESLYHGDPVAALLAVLDRLEGSFALGVLFADRPDEVYAVRRESPLVVAVGEHARYLASDVTAVLPYTRRYYLPENDEVAVLTRDTVTFYGRDRKPLEKPLLTADWEHTAAEKGGYPHFMLKEIFEQPAAVRATLAPYIRDGLPALPLSAAQFAALRRLHVVACGTAMHAGLSCRKAITALTDLPVSVEVASEFRYALPPLDKTDAVLVISQSGETADTLAALRAAKTCGALTVAVVNVTGSTIAREADVTILTAAGPEIAVASTKAYMVQLAVTYLFTLQLALARGNIDEAECRRLTAVLWDTPRLLEESLKRAPTCEEVAKTIAGSDNLLYIGRGSDYPLALEGALKLKEISYIHAEAYPAGELKHGTISLITEGMPLVAVVTDHRLLKKTTGNIKEAKARGARTVAVHAADMTVDADIPLPIPVTDDLFAAMPAAVPLQLLAYYTAVARGCDVDKPRNLAKSVTVE
ncbi:MAG: glutamine--fructose-6-phosphate transaminase (isomerizing) [Ruminococcaceae bacterium]|nr:glutamine--fructose-6-phosphate transaminase (isomerizing) [Oscillospiraceae bacterium]